MWDVVTVDEFDEWFLSLNEGEQTDVLAVIKVLEMLGPQLGRPYVDTLTDAKLANLKELRIQHRGNPYRVLFAFDPKRQAVLLCGGDKSNNKRFYRRMILIAEREYEKHIRG